MTSTDTSPDFLSTPPDAPRHVIVVGASAGGLAPLTHLLECLQPEPTTVVLVAVHANAESPGFAPVALARRSAWPIVWPSDNSRLQPGQVYIAPPDRHLVVRPHRVRVVRGPKENGRRPAIDVLFRSAAVAYGPIVAGVLLSGPIDDGAAGMLAIRACGGLAIVQDLASAEFPEMPNNALRAGAVDHSLRMEEMCTLLNAVVREPIAGDSAEAPERLRVETEFSLLGRDIDDMSKLGQPTGLACPGCDGPLWEVEDGGIARYRCHTGHAYSAESLMAGQEESVERALFVALRTLQERTRALKTLARPQHSEGGQGAEKIRASDEAAAVIRALLVRSGSPARPGALDEAC